MQLERMNCSFWSLEGISKQLDSSPLRNSCCRRSLTLPNVKHKQLLQALLQQGNAIAKCLKSRKKTILQHDGTLARRSVVLCLLTS